MSVEDFPKEISEIKGKQNTSFVLVIFINGDYIRLPLDLVYKYRLGKGVQIDEVQYNIILRNLKIINGKKFAYAACSKRARTEKEIAQLLRRKGYLDDEISEIKEFLKEYKLINDEEYIITAINYYYTKKKFGPFRIKLELLKKGFRGEAIDTALKNLTITDEDEFELALKILEKKKNLINSKDKDKKKIYIYQVLGRYGISNGTIIKVLNSLNISYDDIE